MKFIKLEILNLASLDRPEGETINFEEGALGNSHIFSIIGPTGSGKSTLLDAICLSLYNRAPRYLKNGRINAQKIKVYGQTDEGESNRAAPTDPRNILTRGKKRGYSKLTFQANNGTYYRAEWHVAKGTKNIGDPTTHLYRLTLVNNRWIEEVDQWDTLPQIIGLGYDQFLQTVLIAQGSFANFLKAGEDDRFLLLEKLIGCEELYSNITTRIREEHNKASLALAEANSNIAREEQDIIKDDLPEVLARHQELEATERQEKAELTQVVQAIGWYTQQERLEQDLLRHQQEFAVVQQQLQDFQPQAEWLALHDATMPAIALHKEIIDHQTTLTQFQASLSRLAQQIALKDQTIQQEVQVKLKQLQEAALQATQHLEQQRPHIVQARAIQVELLAIRKSQAEKATICSEAEKARRKAQNDLTTNQQNILIAQTRHEQAQQLLSSLLQEIRQADQNHQQRIQAATTRYTEQKEQLDQFNAVKLQQDLVQADQALNQLCEAIRIQESLLSHRLTKDDQLAQQQLLTQRNLQISETLPAFHIDQLDQELQTLRHTYTLMTSQDWQSHRGLLSEGEACPLCGSMNHPYCRSEVLAPVQDELKALIDQKQELRNQQNTEREKLLNEHSQNAGQLRGIDTALAQCDKELSLLDLQWNRLNTLHPDWPNELQPLLAMRPQVEAEAQQAAQALQNCNQLSLLVDKLRKDKEAAENEQHLHELRATEQQKEAELRVNEANTILQAEQGKTANLQAQLDERTETLTAAQQALLAITSEVQAKTHALQAEVGNQDPDSIERALTLAKDEAARNVNTQNETIAHLREELNALKGSEETLQKQRDNEQTMLTTSKQALNQWLKAYPTNPLHQQALTPTDIAQLYAATDAWEDIRSHQLHLTQAFTVARTTLDNDNKAHASHQATKPQQSREILQARLAELQGHDHAELIELRARLLRHHQAVQKAGNLLQKQQAAQLLFNEWDSIYDAIGNSEGKTLRKIAQCYTLRFLIAHANAEIRKFNRRYELIQVKNSLAIRVIDHDRADDIRDTSSLSGGETFIVSLALALGLSSLSSRNNSFQNLFIDEGFGTLDPDTLATVIDSLAMLQSSQGKKVGVISHTDTMSERITTQIRIIKNGNSGSSRIEVYP